MSRLPLSLIVGHFHSDDKDSDVLEEEEKEEEGGGRNKKVGRRKGIGEKS